MYTVLWTKSSIGYEEVLPSAKRIWLRDKTEDLPPAIGIEFADNSTIMFNDGNFYVMNENGKTVAHYHLGLNVTSECLSTEKSKAKK